MLLIKNPSNIPSQSSTIIPNKIPIDSHINSTAQKNTQRDTRKARGHNQTRVVGDFISLSQHNVAHYSMGDSTFTHTTSTSLKLSQIQSKN